MSIINPYEFLSVSLAAVSDETQQDENLDPPFVRVRAGNGAFLHLDGGFEDTNSIPEDNASLTIGQDNNRIYIRKIKRFSVAGLQIGLATPNINPRNNVVYFQSNVGGVIVSHRAVLTEGWYTTLDTAQPDSALLALQRAMNAAVPLPPGGAASFAVTSARTALVPWGNPLQGVISSAASPVPFTWRFELRSDNLLLEKGRNMFNLPRDQAYTSVKTCGACQLLYSRYLDICSKSLTQYTKNPTSSNQGPLYLYARVYLKSPLLTNNSGFTTMGVDFSAFMWTQESTNFRRDRSFETVDIEFRDEFGDRFYIPSLATSTRANTDPSLILVAEI